MDKEKKLEQFFKNRVNDFDSKDGDWDLPDASVFKNAQMHFPKHPKKRKRKLGYIFWIATGVLLLSMLGYIFYLNQFSEKAEQKVKDLESKLSIAKKDLKENKEDLKNLKKDFSKEISELKNQNQIAAQTIKTLSQQNHYSKKIANQKNNQIDILTSENEILKNQITSQIDFSKNKYSNSVFSKKNDFQKEQQVATLLARSIPFLTTAKNVLEISNNKKALHYKLIPSNKHKRKFEIGLNYSSMNFEMPLIYDFEKLDADKFEKKEFHFPIQTKGASFYLAYSIRPNIWVTTGFRRTSGGFEKSFSSGLIYDKSGEYIDDDGKTINEFDIKTQTGFSDSGSSIDFEIPSGTDIDDGDFLKADWNYEQHFQFSQIPIGLNYFFGKNKLQGYLRGGLGWNKIEFGEYFFETTLKYENEILPINKNEKDKKDVFSSQFLNGFAGVGLNYQLTQSWNARTSFSLEKNFIQKNKFLNSNALSKVLEVGLNFRF